MSEYPLAGVEVLDCTTAIPGPYCTALLRELGARVVKVEPRTGDPTRMFPALYAALNAGKESLALDLRDDADLLLARDIAERTDVFVEGWRPGVATRLGLGADEMLARNDRLVYCSIAGYPSQGPLRDRAGHDINYLAASGLLRLMAANAPQPPRVPIADMAAGTYAAFRIVAAVLEARSGTGSVIEVSLEEVARSWVRGLGSSESPIPTLHELPHYGVFETEDGEWLALGVVHEDRFWTSLCRALGLEGLADLDLEARVARRDELRVAVARAVRRRRRHDLESALAIEDTCWSFVQPPEIPSGSPPAAPGLGDHNEALRREFRQEET